MPPEAGEKSEPAVVVATPLEKWNEPRANAARYMTTLYSFIVIGMNDGAIGALIPYIGPFYGVSYTVLSLVFLSSFAGYTLAALSNSLIHRHLGQRGVAWLGPWCRLVAYIPLSFHPPFPALPVLMLFAGWGNGIGDSAWNAWVGNMHRANELLGFLHASYGLGATIGPLVATSMISRGNLPWYTFYYLMIGLAAVEAIAATFFFRAATGKVYRDKHEPSSSADEPRALMKTILREPVVYLASVFLLGYVGVEVAIGSWTVEFMRKVRHAEDFAAGMTVTGFWLGLTVGRVVLGFVTERTGEKLAISIYLLLSIALQVVYWLVPSFLASAFSVAFLGFFLGPLFPAAIVAAAKLLPSRLHVAAIGFAAAFGGGGAAIFPFAVGAIAQSKGVEVLQPVVLAILVFITIVWAMFPGGLRRGGLEMARERNEGVAKEVRQVYHWLRNAWR